MIASFSRPVISRGNRMSDGIYESVWHLGLFVKPPPEARQRLPSVLRFLECEAGHLVCVLAQTECQQLEPETVWER